MGMFAFIFLLSRIQLISTTTNTNKEYKLLLVAKVSEKTNAFFPWADNCWVENSGDIWFRINIRTPLVKFFKKKFNRINNKDKRNSSFPPNQQEILDVVYAKESWHLLQVAELIKHFEEFMGSKPKLTSRRTDEELNDLTRKLTKTLRKKIADFEKD